MPTMLVEIAASRCRAARAPGVSRPLQPLKIWRGSRGPSGRRFLFLALRLRRLRAQQTCAELAPHQAVKPLPAPGWEHLADSRTLRPKGHGGRRAGSTRVRYHRGYSDPICAATGGAWDCASKRGASARSHGGRHSDPFVRSPDLRSPARAGITDRASQVCFAGETDWP